MRYIFTWCLFLLASVGGFAQQNGLISGKVVDGATRLSLPGATIKLNVGNRYTISTQSGNFEFLNVPSGTYEVSINYLGYQPATAIVTVTGRQNVVVDFELDAGGTQLDEVMVMGDRLRGQASALNQQKNNANITNVISSDQVGRFPDANIGDALKRVPGITMQNDQGEARNIIIRGLAPSLNSVMLNGDRIPSAEGDNRNVQMDLIPSDMIQTIVVNKTLTPDMDADAIGGSVNLITRAAPNGQRISATLAGGYNPIREKAAYTGAFIYGNRFAQGKIGMVLSGSYNNNDYGSDNVEAAWKEDDFGNVYVEEQDIRKYDVRRTRRSLSAAFDFNLSPSHSLYLNGMYNWRDDWENRFRWNAKDIEPLYDANDNIIGYQGAMSLQTKGGINNNRVKQRRLEEQKVQNYAIGGNHLFGSALDVDWSANFSRASEYRPNERYIEYEIPYDSDEPDEPGVAFNKDFGASRQPLLTFINDPSLSDYDLDKVTEQYGRTTEEEFGAKLNFRIPLSVVPDQKGRLRFGGRLRLKSKDRNNIFHEYSPIGDIDFDFDQIPLNNLAGMNWVPDNKYAIGILPSKDFLGNLPLTDASQFESEADPSEYLAANYHAKETILAGYLRWDQDLSRKFSMIAGARVERTGITYTGNIIQDEEALEGVREVKNDYVNILPNLSVKYNAASNFVLRAAFTTGIARPDYYALAPYIDSRPSDEELFAGNPELSASYAWNFDLMGEYYFQSIGLISGGAFYKSINNFIYIKRDEQYTTDKFSRDFGGLSNPISTGENWTFVQAQNGDNVQVYGLEVSVQRQLDFFDSKFLKGFGVYLNYTFTDSEAKGITNEDGEERDGLSLPGSAPHMFNASLSWEDQRFSARLSLNHAAAYLDELGGDAFEDRYYDKQTFLDANASYRITKALRVFAEANNLTNQPLRYYQGIASRTMQMEYYRPRYNLGLKLDL
ncbi:TonB-dependent receptor [Parapedobacter tibetensis]|uniref:TonB-dependent receptor n=1 Tax=Parapedobacter tibetensis TaxID=2972951 RepID=UPI00214D417A|nr:TonB-dependent receptor [Parapedobacter tibetensis]